jgi:hypothetical protein
MAQPITLSESDVAEIEKKLTEKRATMPADEVQLLEALVRRANAEKPAAAARGPTWGFSWSYHFK